MDIPMFRRLREFLRDESGALMTNPSSEIQTNSTQAESREMKQYPDAKVLIADGSLWYRELPPGSGRYSSLLWMGEDKYFRLTPFNQDEQTITLRGVIKSGRDYRKLIRTLFEEKGVLPKNVYETDSYTYAEGILGKIDLAVVGSQLVPTQGKTNGSDPRVPVLLYNCVNDPEGVTKLRRYMSTHKNAQVQLPSDIERANKAALNLLCQILDEGRIPVAFMGIGRGTISEVDALAEENRLLYSLPKGEHENLWGRTTDTMLAMYEDIKVKRYQ